MNRYVVMGKVIPERAQITWNEVLGFANPVTGAQGIAEISVIINQIMVDLETETELDIFDIKMIFFSVLRPRLSAVGYLWGRYYDVEITRAYCREKQIDYVYGIEDQLASSIMAGRWTREIEQKIMSHMGGAAGVLLIRALTDLTVGLRHLEDVAFYCYRALEGLRHHCALLHGITEESTSRQWQKFREVSGASEDDLRALAEFSQSVRHGELPQNRGEDRERALKTAWETVWNYMQALDLIKAKAVPDVIV